MPQVLSGRGKKSVHPPAMLEQVPNAVPQDCPSKTDPRMGDIPTFGASHAVGDLLLLKREVGIGVVHG